MSSAIRLIVNPAAGNSRGRTVGRAAAQRLKARRADFELTQTRGPGHAQELAAEFLASCPEGVVAVAGGDGTVHEVVQAFAMQPGRGSLCFVPAGGGNDAALTIGLPRRHVSPVDLALDGRLRVLDLGWCAGEAFFNGVGAGFDGEAAAASKKIPLLRGLPAYLAAALVTLARYEKPRLRLEAAGEVWEGRAMLCAIGNGPSCGGGFRLTPDADPCDGLLDACVLGDFGKVEVLANLPKALRGAHRGHPKAKFFRAAEFTLASDRPLFAHFDGEIRRPEFPIRFSVRPAAIRVRIP